MSKVGQDVAGVAAGISWSGRRAALFLASCSLYAAAVHAQSAPPPASPTQALPAAPQAAPAPTPAPASTPHVSAAAAADAAEAADAAQEIDVEGRRQYGAVTTDVAPEATLNAATITALGAADLEEVFQDLAPEIGTGVANTNGTPQTQVVLVNGQRIAGFSSIKDLPPEAVRRIEIFPEKVALQYGFGPDQKVVNVVLRKNYRSLTILGRYTLAPDNWRGIYRAKADLLRIDQNGHWDLDIDYNHLDPLFAGSTLSGPPGSPDSNNPVAAHTLATQSDSLTFSGDGTRNFGSVTAELAGHLSLTSLQSRLGLSDVDGDLLEQQGSPDLISAPRYRSDQTVDAQTSLTLNGKLDSWRWSFIGKLDDNTRLTQTLNNPGANSFDSIQIPSPGVLGARCPVGGVPDCVSTNTKDASGAFYLNGDLFSLPAGYVTAAVQTGFDFSGIHSVAPLAGQDNERSRDQGNVQANLDFPITSASSAIGKLSVGVNGAASQLSDFGTLTTAGTSLEWTPIDPVQLIASYRREETAPSLLQLGEATLNTPDLREYDFVTGQTSIVDMIDGGNPNLQKETSHVANVRLQVNPLKSTNLTLSAEYTNQRTANPILDITAATAATMAAFPDRFTRNAQGFLTAMDIGPVNGAMRDQQQIRWGLNYTVPFGNALPASPAANAPLVRNQFQIALYDTWRLQDSVVLRDGLPSLNLLGGDFLSDMGGTPQHQVELQTTLSTRKWSADINAQWQTHTTANAGPLSQDQLTFSQGITVNLRIQINLAYQPWITHLLPFLQGNLNISADNLLGAHTTVHTANGMVPLAYGENYLNPTGRTFRITLRKHFR